MKNIYLIIVLTIFTNSIFANNLIVKFKNDTQIDISNIRTNHKFNNADFQKLLGEFKITPLISDNILNQYYKKINPSVISKNINDLEYLFKINYTSNISEDLIISKLKSIPYIDYIEKYPQHKIITNTNDSLIADCYHLDNIKAQDAWNYINSQDTVLVAVVDTGTDIYHEDLIDNIYKNPGEIGLDNNGIDKSSNGIDDDNNGFIDDINGWDFVSSDSLGQDNMPLPGNDHGTHVTGIIGAIINNLKGIAGVSKNIKILPVKISSDSPWAGSVENSYEGLFYAAIAGAKVINCSWGSTSQSQAEQEVIDACINLGALVVAAAGNNSSKEAFYPAAYNGVLSVASVNNYDSKSSFSNFDNSVDVSAPGFSILSTLPNNTYGPMSGTSMASPVATGVCAMTKLAFPNYSPLQIAEQVKANCDNIDSINPAFIGLIGMGRVNSFKSVSNKNSKSVVISSFSINEENNNSFYEENELISISAVIKNILSDIGNVTIKMNIISDYKFELINDEFLIDTLYKDSEIITSKPLTFKMVDKLPLDYLLPIELNAYYQGKMVNRVKTYISFNPSYKTMDYNNISVTLNATGNIGFNDYPNNNQGIGLKYNNSKNILFEGGLMLGINEFNVANVIRGEFQSAKDTYFKTEQPFYINKNELENLLVGTSNFNDSKELIRTNINVNQRVYQSNLDIYKDIIILHYDLTNNSNYDYDSLYAGLFFDWDIGSSSSSNYSDFDSTNKIGYCFSTKDTSNTFSGIKLMSNQNLNFFSIDNDGDSDENPGIYDGFTIKEKWYTISSGLKRLKSNITDVSQVISAGPIKLKQNEEVTISFCISVSNSLNSLIKNINNAENLFKNTDIEVIHNVNNFLHIYPNPAINELNLNLVSGTNFRIYNNIGVLLEEYSNVENSMKIDLSNYISGIYYIKFYNNSSKKFEESKFIINK